MVSMSANLDAYLRRATAIILRQHIVPLVVLLHFKGSLPCPLRILVYDGHCIAEIIVLINDLELETVNLEIPSLLGFHLLYLSSHISPFIKGLLLSA